MRHVVHALFSSKINSQVPLAFPIVCITPLVGFRLGVMIQRFQAYARIIDDVTTLFESVPNGGAFPSSEGQEPLGTMSEGEAQDEAGVPKTFYEDSRRSIGTGLSGVCCGDTALHVSFAFFLLRFGNWRYFNRALDVFGGRKWQEVGH